MPSQIAPTEFQSRVLGFRGACNILNGGGRGSGKSFSMILHLIAHCYELDAEARPLVLRESHAGLQELSEKILSLCTVAFGATVRRNKGDGTIALPTGAVITFTNIGDDTSYAKLQGRTFTGIFADETGNYPPNAFHWLSLVRSNLRPPLGVRPAIHYTCNPHGRSHSKIVKQFIRRAPPWQPYRTEHGDVWVNCTSTLEDNPHIDREQYTRSLNEACAHDAELAKAWLSGDWNTLGGNFFDVFDPAVHLIDKPPYLYKARLYTGADWGTASPSTAILVAELRYDAHPYLAGDIIVLGEADTALSLTEGDGSSPAQFADVIRSLWAAHRTGPTPGTCDDARGLSNGDTVIGLLRDSGIYFSKPRRKDRPGTWAMLRARLQASANGERGGIYFVVGETARLVETLCEAPRGQHRPEDICPRYRADHWLDGLAYALTGLNTSTLRIGRTRGFV